MAQQFKRAQKGDPLRIPAATYNAFCDAAEATQRAKFNQQQQPRTDEPWDRGTILVHNSSGADVGRFGVLAFGGPGGSDATAPLVTPSANLAEFQGRILLDGAAPNAFFVAPGQFVVTLDPIASDGIGRAFLSGVCPVQVDVSDIGHQYAEAKEGDATQLKSGTFGSARILWRETGLTGAQWCLVRLGQDATTQLALGNSFPGAVPNQPLVTDGDGNVAQVAPAAAGTYAFDKILNTGFSVTLGPGGVVTDISIT